MSGKIVISKENRKAMIDLIKKYFLKERDEDLGDLSATMILDFFTKELAPEFYNQGVYDSYAYMNDKMEDLFALQIVKR
ncbi:MAG: DUF2164 domain-containing protein [Syntrophomonas sp.]|nr:DUF2164 domain-containing protein [Syntrophomonas sp.]